MAGEDDLDLLAGEYVLGTLLPDERAAVSRRLLDNPDLALRVAAWEARLAPLSEDLAPVVPRPQVWQQVKRAITEGRREARQAWWDRLALWRGLGRRGDRGRRDPSSHHSGQPSADTAARGRAQ